MENYLGLYDLFCPNCHGINSDNRNIHKYPCSLCLEKYEENNNNNKDYVDYVYQMLVENKSLKDYKDIKDIKDNYNRYRKFFKKLILAEPWSIQRSWFKRVLKNKSFTALAPTGIGKTTFGIITALYYAVYEKKRSLIILPNTSLLLNIKAKIEEYLNKINKRLNILFYSSSFINTPLKKKEFFKLLDKNKFDVLVITNNFLSRNFKSVENKFFDFVFADDTDSLLRTSKNIEYVLKLIGFSDDDIKLGYEYVKSSFVFSKKSGDNEFLINHISLKRQLESLSINKKIGILVLSTATNKAKGIRVKLFKALLSFDIGERAKSGSNVVDLYDSFSIDNLRKYIKLLGSGGIIFVPIYKGLEYANYIFDSLKDEFIVKVISSDNVKNIIEEFSEGKIDIIIGVASSYGLLVRGIDLPEIIRYAIFVGVPSYKFKVDFSGDSINSFQLIRLLGALSYVTEGEDKLKIERQLKTLKKNYFNTKVVEYSLLLAKDYIKRNDIVELLKNTNEVIFKEDKDGQYFLVPDVPTYIQASGRTSRLSIDGFTKGLSIILEDDRRLISFLEKRIKWLEDRSIKNFNDVDISKIISQIDKDREKIKILKEHNKIKVIKDKTFTALMIVESPTKANLIANLIGKPTTRYLKSMNVYEVSLGSMTLIIGSIMGHIYDITTENYGFYGVDVENNRYIPKYLTIKVCKKCKKQFTSYNSCPLCGSDEFYDKKDIIIDLIEVSKEVDTVFISTDPDSEGEKIGWDIYSLLSPYVSKIKRVVFHEITKRGILEGFKNIGLINQSLVKAQILRRIQDRWIGFKFSSELKDFFDEYNISAGRVQTPVLGYIIDRVEYNKNNKRKYYRIKTEFFSVDVPKDDIKNIKKIDTILIEDSKYKKEKIAPMPPFTTDSLLSSVNRVLKLSVSEAISIAQDLFENGLITYHRTDSIHVSDYGKSLAYDYINEKFNKDVIYTRSWGEEGTHECIRPTRGLDVKELREMIYEGDLFVTKNMTQKHFSVYDLIFKRFIASQMRDVVVKKQELDVKIDSYSTTISLNVDIYKDGWNLVSPISVVKPVKKKSIKIDSKEKFVKPDKPLFDQASVIEIMKERGLGRPSTYSQIISTLLSRGYIIEGKYNKLIPTKKGVSVYKYLIEKYKNIFSEERTRALEELMKEIENGRKDYKEILSDIYNEIKTN
ncbi:MAG TPA: reverse gyrase [Spirochaetota bacterium]|nr:reverse gyrase [Spirochaetota bacterium]HOM37807.1 reverse gyrase [Spirochaetota bacterium]HPQ49316.1 reverse gyrase [Spirochaetota bacterium]